MARTNNLANFLADIAAAIKEKKSDETAISASNFDTEILALPSIDTSDATATVNTVLSGKTAYVNGSKIIGTYYDKYIKYDEYDESTGLKTNSSLYINLNEIADTVQRQYAKTAFEAIYNNEDQAFKYQISSFNEYLIDTTTSDAQDNFENLDYEYVASYIGALYTTLHTYYDAVPIKFMSPNGNIVSILNAVQEDESVYNNITHMVIHKECALNDIGFKLVSHIEEDPETGDYRVIVDKITRIIDTSDATATANDIIKNMSAYVNGQKINGTIVRAANGDFERNVSDVYLQQAASRAWFRVNYINPPIAIGPGGSIRLYTSFSNLASQIGLTADKLVQGVTVLGVVGTHDPYQIRIYTSVTTMNNDLDNIPEGDVVKVVEGTTTTFYIKETTMKQLIKAEDTISQEEYEELNDVADNILGE